MAAIISSRPDKQSNAFELLREQSRPDRQQMMFKMQREIDRLGEAWGDKQCESIQNDPELYDAVRIILGMFEDISIAIQYDWACEKILFKSIRFMVVWHYEKLKPYILERRKLRKNDDLYVEIEKLAKCWAKGKSIINGEKIE